MNGINIGVTEQLVIFGISCLIGMGLGLFYDFFRVLRKAIPHSWFFIGAEDLIFFIVSTTYSFKFMVSVLDGKIRFFIIIGELLGWVIYFFSLGVVVMRLSDVIISVVKFILSMFVKIFILPIILTYRYLVNKVVRFSILSKKRFKKSAKYSKLRLKRRGVLVYNFNKARLFSYRHNFRSRRKNNGTQKEKEK